MDIRFSGNNKYIKCAFIQDELQMKITLSIVDENIWASAWQNQQNDLCTQQTQISLGICPIWLVFAVSMKKYWVLSYSLSA